MGRRLPEAMHNMKLELAREPVADEIIPPEPPGCLTWYDVPGG